jgi:8-oxo-dGTP pyrophosphatase MutT (NUDIX family)
MILKPNVTVAAVVECEGKFLFVEEAIDGKLVLNQPAGHLDPGESLLDAVVRETREEAAWDFEPDFLVGVYRWQMAERDRTYLRFTFAGSVSNHDPDQPLDDTIQRTVWARPDELNGFRIRSPLVTRSLDDFLEGHRYPLSLLADIADAS